MTTSRWKPGETIVHHEVWKGRLWGARPLTVVEDSPNRLVLWCPKGTVRKVATTPPTRPRAATRGERLASLLELRDWTHTDHEWDVSTLWILEPDDWYAVWVSWLPDGSHWGWYVNFQEPLRPMTRGFQSMDLMLDILVDPDRTWRWKDDDEFELMIDRGIYDKELATKVRTEAERIIRKIESNEPPFNEAWPAWQPPVEWELPELPSDWSDLT